MKKIKIIALLFMLAFTCALANADTLPIKKLDYGKVTMLFEGNILKYYNVDKKLYDSPLKEKKFLESADYKTLKSRFEEEHSTIITNKYVLSSKVKSQFNMTTSTFTFELPSQFKKKLALQTTDSHFKDMKFKTPQMDEDTAYKIEMGESTFELVIRLTGEIDRKHHNALCCVPVKIVIRNKAGQILYEYIVPAEPEQTNE